MSILDEIADLIADASPWRCFLGLLGLLLVGCFGGLVFVWILAVIW